MSETGNISISENDHYITVSSTKVEMDRTISFLFADKQVDLPVKITADFKDLNPRFHEMFMRVMSNNFPGINVHNGHFTSDGKDATPHLNSKPKNSEPWECEKCGAIIGIVGKKLEKWLPFFFSHRCKPTVRK